MKDPNLENEQKHKNKLTSILRKSERLYHRNELDKAKLDNTKRLEVLYKIICKGKSKASNIPYTLIESNKKYYEPKATANAFNNYFTDVGSSISSNISYHIHDYLSKKCEKSVFLMSAAESEIVFVMTGLSSNKSTDYIGLNMEIIKHVIPNIAKPLYYISNKSLLDGRFSDKMKIVKIIPIYKSDDKNLICNYIPISLLPQMSKISPKNG